MLVNEYFPTRTPRMHPGLQRAMRDYYDFAVRCENLLSMRDVTDGLRISSHTHKLGKRGESGVLWTLAKVRDDGVLAINLINLNGVDDQWRNPSGNPTPQTRIELKVHGNTKVQRVWVATPDDGLGRPRELTFQTGEDADGSFVAFTVPNLAFWNLVILIPEPPTVKEP